MSRARRLAPALALALLIAALAGERLVDLGQPLGFDQLTQRVLNATFPVDRLIAGRYPDSRHPPLGYLVLAPFVRVSLDVAWVRLPTVLASLLGFAALWRLGRRVVGPWAALAPVVLFGLNLTWLDESRSVSDLPLLVALALTSSEALLAALARPTWPRWGLWAVLAAAMAWTWYLAPVVLVAQLAGAVAARPPWPRLLGATLLAGGLTAPLAPRLLKVVTEDMGARQVAASHPQHVWGDRGATDYLADAARVFGASPASVGLLLVLVAVGGWRLWRSGRRAEAVLVAGLPLLTAAATAEAARFVRLQPYYVLFAVPFAGLAATAGALGLPGARARWTPALLALVLLDAGRVYVDGAWRVIARRPHDDYAAIGGTILAGPEGARVVAEPHYLASPLAFYATRDPGATWRACRIDEDRLGQRCGHLVLLRISTRVSDGFEADDVARFRAVRDEPLWYVRSDGFPNADLDAEVTATCEHRLRATGLDLYWCPPQL